MPTFQGTLNEYHKHVGPRIRNTINVLCRPLRLKQKGICTHCKKSNGYLESAHIKGKERKKLIEQALKPFADGQHINCTLEKAEELIIKQHLPIEKTFIFLCNACHRIYDAEDSNKQKVVRTKKITKITQEPTTKFHRLERWAKNPQQINSQIVQSYLDLCLANEGIEEDEFIKILARAGICKRNKGNIKSNLNSMISDKGNSHGLIFKKENHMYQMPDYIFKFACNVFKIL